MKTRLASRWSDISKLGAVRRQFTTQLAEVWRTVIQIVGHQFPRNLVALWRRAGRGPLTDGWRTEIDQVVEDLQGLNCSTERDFLGVGEKLTEFRSASRQIASDMAALTELISGAHGSSVSDSLNRILEHSREMDTQIEQSGQLFGQVHDFSCRIRFAFGGLRNTVSIFRTLCILTRIETSRLGSAGADFGDLAAEVKPLSESIQSSGEGVLEASAQLEQSVQSATRSASGLRATQLKELPALIAGVINGLKSFEERRRRAAESSTTQAAQYEAICDAVDGVVRSIQTHDITRQQIEHVVQALRQLRCEFEGGRGTADSLPANARAIVALQSSQLSGAAGTFASSVERMERDLESISVRVQEMAKASRSLMGVSGNDQDSFFLQMEGHFTAILQRLVTCTAGQAEMESTAANLEKTIATMRDSISEIRGIEIRIQRIAINATIRSAHIGGAGNALNVIAEVMQRLALDSNTNTEEVAVTLDSMRAAVCRVSGGFGSAVSNAGSGTNRVMDELRHAVVEVHSSTECSFSRVTQIAVAGARLAGEIGAVRSGFSAGRLFAQVVNRARAELERVGSQSGQKFLEGVEVAPAQQLESLSKHYTMQTERDVHESVARGSVLMAEAPIVVSKAAFEDGDLGDNVELF